MDNYHFTVSDQEMNLLMTAIQCAMLEASYLNMEEMMDACRFIELTPFNVLMEMLEEAALLREEEQALWEVWAEHCF